jgi:hypothetical protein
VLLDVKINFVTTGSWSVELGMPLERKHTYALCNAYSVRLQANKGKMWNSKIVSNKCDE